MINRVLSHYRGMSKMARASIWFFICSFLQRGISVITTPIFTRLLNSAEYGQFSVFNSWLGIITVFVSLRLYYGVFSQGLIKFENEKTDYISALEGLEVVLVLAWTVIYCAFHNFWNELFGLNTIQMLAMLLMIWTTAVFNFWAEQQRVELEYKKLVVLTVLVSFLKPILGIIVVCISTDKVTARIVELAIVELIAFSPLFIYQVRKNKKLFSKKFWIYSLSLNIPLVPHYLSQTILSSADRIMIERMIGADKAGIYSLAYSVSMFIALACNALEQTITPWIYKKIKANAAEEIHKLAYLTLGLMGCGVCLFVIFAPEVVAFFAPAEYYEAIWIIPPVTLSVYFMYMYSLFSTFEFYFEKTRLISVATCLSAIINIVLNSVFMKKYGYFAAGYTTLFCYAFYAFAHYVFMKRICKKQLSDMKVYNPIVLGLITGIIAAITMVSMILYPHRILRYGIFVAFIVVIILQKEKVLRIVNLIIGMRKDR